ncbi:MAG: TraR/DksA C4-type zinc finger protein [Ignavibacteriae bacterium]|nr:TraR/DksA C4-type zinc finger protein [Ignavibacteriota bacterium]
MATKKSAAKKTTAKPKAKPKASKPVKKKVVKKTAPKKEVKIEIAAPVKKVSHNSKGYGKRDLEFFRGIINEKKKEIFEELETLRDTMMDSMTGEYTSENPTYSTHMEQGTDTMEREKTFLFAAREGKFLNYLEEALKRIDAGVYGKCNVCGKLIEKERLEAVPHAQQCLDCKLNKGK